MFHHGNDFILPFDFLSKIPNFSLVIALAFLQLSLIKIGDRNNRLNAKISDIIDRASKIVGADLLAQRYKLFDLLE